MKYLEQKLRRQAKKQGYILQKSRARKTYTENVDDFGGYRIISADNNFIVTGEKYNLSIEDVMDFLEQPTMGRKAKI